MNNMQVNVADCNDEDFPLIKDYINRYELDNREMAPEQFLTVKGPNGLKAFGRVRAYGAFSEICSIGVLENKRGAGYGKKVTEALINRSVGPLYVVTVIPEFFKRMGFSLCSDYPREIADKLYYCLKDLPVEAEYVVLLKN
jgi:N-acetylglutamate synthase-like GNAT family acetyltransferase